MMNPEQILSCPNCKNNFTQNTCRNCGFVLDQVNGGIYQMAKNKNFYFREKMPQPVLAEINKATDIFAAAYEAFKKTLPWKYDFYALESNRGAGTILSKLGPDSIVLDYGAGWGNLAKFASLYCKHVFAMDLTLESLEFCDKTSKRENMTFIHGGDYRYFPFKDKSLDAVFLNGVLEWIPEYDLSESPRTIQLNFLKEIRRVLKDDGQVFIGIENRIGFPYFFGKPDEHSKIRFGTLMPRVLADLVSKIKFHKPYRTFTYGPRGYKRLLKEAGFEDNAINVPASDYREIIQIFLPEAKKNLVSAPENDLNWKRKVKNLARRLFYPSFLSKYFAHAFLITSNWPKPNLLKDVLLMKGEHIIDAQKVINNNLKGTILVETENYIYKVPAHPKASVNLKTEINTIEELAKSDWLNPYLPKIELASINNTNIQIINKEKQVRKAKGYYAEIKKFLDLKNRNAQSKSLADAIQDLNLQNVREYLGLNGKNDLLDRLMAKSTEIKVQAAPAHGDLHTNNILATAGGIKIIDWEFYAEKAPVEFDLISLVLYEETFVKKTPYHDLMERFLNQTFVPSPENNFSELFPVIKAAHPLVLATHFMYQLSFALGRYENVAFVPYQKDQKYKKTLEIIEKCMATI